MRSSTPETIRLLGGRLCLDLANAVDRAVEGGDVDPAATDVLTEPGHVARWGVRLGLLERPVRIPRAELDAVRVLREALYATFAAPHAPPPGALEVIRHSHAEAAAAGSLHPGPEGGIRLDWPAGAPERVRFAVAEDAVRLLADPAALARVTRCPGRDCGWLFVNASGRRRWCSMDACGSREKTRRAYARKRVAG